MRVNSKDFHAMLGHVEDGCVIIAPSGREFTLKNRIKGWVVCWPDGSDCSGYLPSAADVSYFVVNGLQTS